MDDLISRQAAIDALEDAEDAFGYLTKDWREVLEQLPPIHPVNNSEMPNSSDVISRQKAIDAVMECYDNDELFEVYEWKLNELPTIQPEITHEQAIDYLHSTGWMQEHDRQMMLDGVHRLTAQPEIVRCKDCKHWIPYDWMFSEAWQSKDIADYPEDEIGCNWCDMAMKANDFCSRGEKREETI